MLISKNPYTGENLNSFEEMEKPQIDQVLNSATTAFEKWKNTSFEERASLMKKAGEELRNNKNEYATAITREMGKPITQALAEIEKCAWVCDYYAINAKRQLSPETIKTDALKSYISYEPLGVILAIMPWNYPFWQVFRFAAPGLMAGNVGILKHASNVMGSGHNIQKVFERAGFPKGCFQNMVISSKRVEEVIRDPRVKAISITGSTAAGSAVAATAGEEIKKSVLELGGSNALVVFKDANLKETVKICVQARFQNTGQSCIAGKRLLLQDSISEKFLKIFKEEVRALKSGDPMDPETYIGVLAREDLAKTLEEQVNLSVEKGAEIILGGKREGAYYEPTIISKVTQEMPVFKEETFGPAISVMTFTTEKEAVDLVNSSQFGLGVSIFTDNQEKAQKLVPQFEDGAVFVNSLVKSDPRLPFGGTKKSGYGRELSFQGIREFVNIKTVFFHKF